MTIDEFIQHITHELDGTSRVPLYEQIAQHILGAIQRGDLAPATVLPPSRSWPND